MTLHLLFNKKEGQYDCIMNCDVELLFIALTFVVVFPSPFNHYVTSQTPHWPFNYPPGEVEVSLRINMKYKMGRNVFPADKDLFALLIR
jgi:hypothetical protein